MMLLSEDDFPFQVRMAYSQLGTRRRTPTARAVQLVQFEENSNRPFFSEDELKKVVCSPAVRDLPTIVISIGGVARSGKSFMLNLFISYLSYVEEVSGQLYVQCNVIAEASTRVHMAQILWSCCARGYVDW